ncbi:SPW repeat domain-containing protein [Sphingobacterium pedocola]|nr:SPW repeat protein [Sphingobacterium pedocola]
MKAIPTTFHAFIDYGSAIVFLVAPWIFLFDHVTAAKWTSVIVGALILLMSLLTRYESGLLRIIPMRMHLAVDIVIGLFLVLSPWLMGFADQTFLFHVFMGVVSVIMGAFTKRYVKSDNLALR